MDLKKLTRIFQPHLFALLGLFALNVLFFSPLVNGKKLKQEDINQFEYITRFNEKTDDKSILSKYSDNFNGTIDPSLWTDNMLGGMPIYLIHNDDKGNILNDLIGNLTVTKPTIFFCSIKQKKIFRLKLGVAQTKINL
jgi:hypothetical protein